jgi:hypothetical protein
MEDEQRTTADLVRLKMNLVRRTERLTACLRAQALLLDAIVFARGLVRHYDESPRPRDEVDLHCMQAASERLRATQDALDVALHTLDVFRGGDADANRIC